MNFAMKLFGSGFSAQIDDTAGKLAPISAKIIVLHLEFANRVLRRNNDGQIDIADIQRLAVEILRALIAERTPHLIVTPAKRVGSHGLAACLALSNCCWGNGNQVIDVAP